MKVGIAYTDAGGGHKAGAKAIYLAFKNQYPQIEVEMFDLFRVVKQFPFEGIDDHWRKSTESKLFMSLNSLLFRLTYIKIIKNLSVSVIRRIFGNRFQHYILKNKYTHVISTHFLVTVVLSGNSNYKLYNIITDLVKFPSLQAISQIQEHFAPTTDARSILLSLGVPNDKIRTPYFPNYFEVNDTKRLKIFDNSNHTVMIVGGGYGASALYDVIDIIARDTNFNLIIQCGKSGEVLSKVKEIVGGRDNTKLIGFVSNYLDYVVNSDLIIAKPGPATIHELEILRKKSIFLNHVGPQEQQNFKFLKANPNFRYIKDLKKPDLLDMVRMMLMKDVDEFKNRFSNRSAVDIVEEIMNNA